MAPGGEVRPARRYLPGSDTWRLTVDVLRQAVCNWFPPGGAQAAPSGDAGAMFWFLWLCVVYRALGEPLKMDLLWHSLSYGSKWYPLSCGSG